ncbi:P-loop containing nucleoside triphosphate hydrolase protein [Globomyces pollinis-pini]|nr:P-loop containing nucleoside triphosphate hydrolase protein [Globomyces pollinis-pini]
MKVTRSPSDEAARTNCVYLSPTDIQSNTQYILIEDQFPFSARIDTTVTPGTIGTTLFQRKFARLSLNQDVRIRPLDPNTEAFIQTITLSASILRKTTVVTDYLDTDSMGKLFMNLFDSQIFAIDQSLFFEFQGIDILVVVTNLETVDVASIKAGPFSSSSNSNKRGILMKTSAIQFIKAADSTIKLKGSTSGTSAPNAIIKPDFNFSDLGIGGLDNEFANIFRRAFVSRIFPPSVVEKMGISHVKGTYCILLFGPPGTGKTLIARQIGKMLNARDPLIVNGPEILNKFVGQSEENVRKLFAPAEAEYKAKGEESSLHIIIFDELDAICKQRGSKNDGTGVGDSVVNQLLSKMDGVDQLNNILIIGMTNRMDMIDEALLRPGRLEIHVEISLADEAGRVQIFNIHTAKMKKHDLLDADVSIPELASLTNNFSGAEIGGLIKSASSFAFNRHVKIGEKASVAQDFDKVKVCRSDFLHALEEIHPAFGVSEAELQQSCANGVIKFSPNIERILTDGQLFVDQVKNSKRTPLVSVLLHGPVGSGKTALAATIAIGSEFPFIKLISPEAMVGFTETAKMSAISKIFSDASKSPASVIVIDSIERLLDWVAIGPRFSNPILQTLLVLLKKKPEKNHKLLILATTSQKNILEQMDLIDAFNASVYVPNITDFSSIDTVLAHLDAFNEIERRTVLDGLTRAGLNTRISVGIKKLIYMSEMATQDEDKVSKLVTAISEDGVTFKS